MKKILYSVMAMAALTFSFASLTSCEDVPAPYEMPDVTPDEPSSPDVEPAGTGTQADPYNVAAAIKYIDNGGAEDKEVYVKGKVVSVQSGSFDPSYGSLKYYISDDGTATNQFLVFNGYAGPNRTKFSGEDALKPGDEVVICGKLVNYNGTKEFTTGNYIVSINGNGGGGSDQPAAGQPTGDGTKANPFNSVAANQYASSLAAGVESDKDVYIKGKVVSVKEQYGTQFGNATFYISDDGKADNQFYVFRALYLNNEKYTSGATLNVGDEVVVCGKVVNYMGNTPETVQGKAYLVSLKSNGGSGSEGGTTGDASASNGDFENWTNGLPNNWKTASSAGNATLSQSTDAHSGKYSVKVGGTSSANKRLGYKEITLKPGEYTVTFYAKAATSTGASVRPGYVPVKDGANPTGSDYKYGDYVNDITATKWVKVTYTFTIETEGTYSVLVMNAKKPGGDVLIDDYTLTMGSTVIIK